jgi:hypothetical protein
MHVHDELDGGVEPIEVAPTLGAEPEKIEDRTLIDCSVLDINANA